MIFGEVLASIFPWEECGKSYFVPSRQEKISHPSSSRFVDDALVQLVDDALNGESNEAVLKLLPSYLAHTIIYIALFDFVIVVLELLAFSLQYAAVCFNFGCCTCEHTSYVRTLWTHCSHRPRHVLKGIRGIESNDALELFR